MSRLRREQESRMIMSTLGLAPAAPRRSWCREFILLDSCQTL